mmetsp:Transcript_8375/g.23949  ORF Transcript_8375/g.23949 Transcript_8375/m.23949 type:complete len:384 (+) Transcript_8375:308-1459(+)
MASPVGCPLPLLEVHDVGAGDGHQVQRRRRPHARGLPRGSELGLGTQRLDAARGADGRVQQAEAGEVLLEKPLLPEDDALQVHVELRDVGDLRDDGLLVLGPGGLALGHRQQRQLQVDAGVRGADVELPPIVHLHPLRDPGRAGLDELSDAPRAREEAEATVDGNDLAELGLVACEVRHHRVELVHLAQPGAVVEVLRLGAVALRIHLGGDGVAALRVPSAVRVAAGRRRCAEAPADARVLVHAEGADPIAAPERALGPQLVPDGVDVAQGHRVRDERVVLCVQGVGADGRDQVREQVVPRVGDHALGHGARIVHVQPRAGARHPVRALDVQLVRQAAHAVPCGVQRLAQAVHQRDVPVLMVPHSRGIEVLPDPQHVGVGETS